MADKEKIKKDAERLLKKNNKKNNVNVSVKKFKRP